MMMQRLTSADLRGMSTQDVFNYGVRHLMAMGRRCADRDGVCLYRDGRGGACVVGAFIPDALYVPDMEGKGALSVAHWFKGEGAAEAGDFFVTHRRVLGVLQSVHDSIHPSGWIWALHRVAQMCDLDAEILTMYDALEAIERPVFVAVRPPFKATYADVVRPLEMPAPNYYEMPPIVAQTSKKAALALLGVEGIKPIKPEPARPAYA